MPQAVIAVIGAVALKVGVDAAVVAIISALASAALAHEEAKRAEGQAKRRARVYPRNATIRSTVTPQQIVYGKGQSGGPLAYINTAHTPSSTNNTDLWWVQPVAGHEVADIEDVWVDDKRTTAAQITTGGGAVLTGSPFYNGGALAFFYKHLGADTQTVDADLQAAFPGDVDNDFRGRGLAYLVARFTLANNSRNMYTGVPQSLRALVKGRKVYDPRRDPSSPYYDGVGSQSLSSDSTWEWSECPPLCLADYLMNVRFGLKVASTAIDWGDVAESADYCDATVSVPGGTEKRFTCNGVLSCANVHRTNVVSILSSFGGTCAKTGGKYRIRAPKWRAAVGTLTNSNIGPALSFRPSAPASDSYNTVRASIYDRDREYLEMDAGEMTTVAA